MSSLIHVRHNLLNQLLNLPRLVQNIQALPAEKFHHIIQEIGIEDSGELVSLATSRQLQDLFDIDVWSNRTPGEAEQFDSDRFWKWMEVLLDAGEAVLLEKVIEMDVELLTFALASQLFVYPTTELEAFFQTDDDVAHQVDMKLESCLCEELYEYQLISRNPESWDVVFTLLVALDKEHHSRLLDLLSQLSGLGEQQVEEEDLFSVLSDIEAMFENMADNRETRRLAKGYVSALDARAFLRLVQVHSLAEILDKSDPDPISSAYFRHYAPQETPTSRATTESAYRDILNILQTQGVVSADSPAKALLPGDTLRNADELLLALHSLAGSSEKLFQQRNGELGFLGNVVAAGCTLRGKRFRTVDASAAVIATCALGVDILTRERNRLSPNWREAIAGTPMTRLFLLGWKEIADPGCSAFAYYANSENDGTVKFFDSLLALDQNPRKR
ncbi:MAG: hypothetical protein JXX29_24285 [Deltaproteobacteria bacterium]|nr:hypothetical protein [Deltaproteobacteria bacterium]MBN2674822.1 hypothetical protein [Deltaproteobacteria bacterium]